MPASLTQLDPQEAWRPASTKIWNRKWAAHLYRRGAFGVPPRSLDDDVPPFERLEQAVKAGQRESIDALLAGGEGREDFDALMDATGDRIARIKARRFFGPQPQKLQGWWLYRMLNTPHPLKERLTLFWHDHFATSLAKVAQSELMFRQNQLLRKHALAKFGPLLMDVGRDPAMLLWLDSNSNVKGKPNENYGRELLELFGLGVGNYTERDVKEAARAFTGWTTAGGEYVFVDSLHDGGEKRVLGRTGNFNGDDVVRIVLEQPACARFLVRKLFAEFISENEPPPAKLIEPLAEQFRKSDYDVAGLIATMLRSNLFFSEHAYRARIKSPVEFVVGSVALLDDEVSFERLAQLMDGLGQTLFAPPNVKGWDGGKAWLNTATLVARHNLAAKLVGNKSGALPPRPEVPLRLNVDFEKLAKKHTGGNDRAAHVDFLLNLFLQGDVDPAVRERLVDYVKENPNLHAAAHTIMTMPEYQLA